jgi:hypothetical protein
MHSNNDPHISLSALRWLRRATRPQRDGENTCLTIAILNVGLFLFGSNPTTLELGMRTSTKGAFEEFKLSESNLIPYQHPRARRKLNILVITFSMIPSMPITSRFYLEVEVPELTLLPSEG